MKKLKCAVIGVGYLGKFHAQKFAHLPNVELVAVCDTNPTIVDEIATSLDVRGVTDYHDLIGEVDAVSIAVPTIYHYEVGKAFLSAGVHVLMEKPITKTVDEAKELIELAKQQNAILQVGHLERFNAARMALEDRLEQPRFIESHRLAPFKPRATDVNVILDLMIHDIDIIQTIVKSPIKHIEAQGAPILSEFIDIANARIRYENGCVANVTASRISFKTERKMRIFQPNSYISLDFQHNKFAVFNKGEGEMFPGVPEINHQETVYEKNDALLLEIEAFVNAILTNSPPLVTGEEGCHALEIATYITKISREQFASAKAELQC